MIRLILNPESNFTKITFYKSPIVIGNGAPEKVDLNLPEETLLENHLEINQIGHQFFAINRANDPFATLNELPFGKKQIKKGDILQIGKTTILFELGEEDISDEENLEEVVQQTISSKQNEASANIETLSTQVMKVSPYEKEIRDKYFNIEKAEKDFLSSEVKSASEDIDIEALFQEVEDLESSKLDDEEQEKAPFQVEEEKVDEIEKKREMIQEDNEQNLALHSIKEEIRHKTSFDKYMIDEFDDENENWKIENEAEEELKPSIFKSRVLWFFIFILFSIIVSLSGYFYYLHLIKQSKIEELRAAEGVADVAMALKYAQIHHIKPEKQNWSDPDFLKNSLASILPHNFTALANIDAEGQFTKTPYILRLYTSKDLSQFLVMAQPEPNLLQWLIPKTAIIVDSQVMEMRKLEDLKPLNRLLVHSDTLEGINAQEISYLIQKSQLIPLSYLAQDRDDLEFSPPKSLELIRAGAENYIYNAPRYYQLGESIMNKVISLTHSLGSSYDISRLKEEIAAMTKMKDVVLYSSKGMKIALQGEKALANFFPQAKFLTAYLSIDSEGKLKRSHLIPQTDPLKEHEKRNAEINSSLIQDQNTNHPLTYQLSLMASDRTAFLQPTKEKIVALLNTHTHRAVSQFDSQLNALIHEYLALNQEQENKITHSLSQLAYDYIEMPVAEFLDYATISGLENLVQDALNRTTVKEESSSFTAEQIDLELQKIKDSKNLIDLDRSISEIVASLTFVNFSDLKDLKLYQNKINLSLIQKLDEFLFKRNSEAVLTFSEKERMALTHALKTAWVTDEEVLNYYLSEFKPVLH